MFLPMHLYIQDHPPHTHTDGLICKWWHTPVILILERLRKEECHGFEASLNYTGRPVSKQTDRQIDERQVVGEWKGRQGREKHAINLDMFNTVSSGWLSCHLWSFHGIFSLAVLSPLLSSLTDLILCL